MICPSCNHENVPGLDQCASCQQDLSRHDLPLAGDRVERSLMSDTVASLVVPGVVTLSATASLAEAMATLLDCEIGAIPILGVEGELVGILSERDVLVRVVDIKVSAARPVAEFMTPRPETVRETDSLAFALHKMDSGGYRHLPVLRNGELVGILSVRDLLRHVTRLCKVL